ncbi:MAG: phosphate acyltransferase PlsX [Candidatus Berkiella sp.]
MKNSPVNTICIALDAMGGDHGPSVVIPAALDVIKNYPNLHLILVGDKDRIEQELAKHAVKTHSQLTIHHATQQVLMDESPAVALRSKRDSSMRVAINLVKEQKAHACVSAGNTGALMAIARFVLKTLPGIDRPAIVYPMPINVDQKKMGRMRMLDLGANVDCEAEHLFQFAVMGSILAQGVDNIPKPKVGLLNIGSEAIKGSEAVKKAAQLLEDSDLNYVGFVEGTNMYQGVADVVVCDGFVGNVALKCSEGVASMLIRTIKRAFTDGWYARFAAFIALPVLKKIAARAEPSQYNGATFLGLNGIVIKSHGNAEKDSYKHAILEAIVEVTHNIPERIRVEVEKTLGARKRAQNV